MHIVCPHCTTSYAIDLATLGAAGRTVRCSRCKEVWLARQPLSWSRKLFGPPGARRAAGKSFVSLPTVCAAMGALVLALIIWRVDVVRLLPQTAMFYKMVGLEVNLRGLMFRDVKITSE